MKLYHDETLPSVKDKNEIHHNLSVLWGDTEHIFKQIDSVNIL